MLPRRTNFYIGSNFNTGTYRPVTTYTGSSSIEPSFYRSPSPSPPKPGRASSNSQKATSLPTPSLDLKPAPPLAVQNDTISVRDPTGHALTSLPTPCSSLESLRRLPSSDPNNPTVIASFTLQPSLGSSQKSILSFDQVVSKVKPLLDRTTGEREISLKGVSPDIVDKLRAKSRASELPGWDNLRYVIDFSSL